MPVKQTLEGIPCVQYNLALGEKKVRRCCYCGYLVKKDRKITHQCNSRIASLMRRYVNLCFNESVEGINGNVAGREIEEMVGEVEKRSSETQGEKEVKESLAETV